MDYLVESAGYHAGYLIKNLAALERRSSFRTGVHSPQTKKNLFKIKKFCLFISFNFEIFVEIKIKIKNSSTIIHNILREIRGVVVFGHHDSPVQWQMSGHCQTKINDKRLYRLRRLLGTRHAGRRELKRGASTSTSLRAFLSSWNFSFNSGPVLPPKCISLFSIFSFFPILPKQRISFLPLLPSLEACSLEAFLAVSLCDLWPAWRWILRNRR